MKKNKKPICSICQLEIQPDDNGWDGTNNPWPVNDGVCCHTCNNRVVLVARINQMQRHHNETRR